MDLQDSDEQQYRAEQADERMEDRGISNSDKAAAGFSPVLGAEVHVAAAN